jgi:hypothetical protein
VVAREGLPLELVALGVAAGAGLTTGDVIEIQFDAPTNMPELSTTAAVLNLLQFSCPFGQDGLALAGKWYDESLLYIVVVSGGWQTPGATDPVLTAIGTLSFTIKASGNLR